VIIIGTMRLVYNQWDYYRHNEIIIVTMKLPWKQWDYYRNNEIIIEIIGLL
jgi:hypothetical protein